jgi:glycosyltransferase involved in cell wall biosynthesis
VKVTISVGGRFHAVKLAEQLEARGYLERIITTKGWYVNDVLPANRWKSIPAAEHIGMAFRKIPALRHRGYYSYIKDNLFDALARKYLVPCDVFHAWGNYALYSIPVARRLGAKVVIERGSTHAYFQDTILKDEFERYGVKVQLAHPQIIEKGLQEIEEADKVIIPSEFVKRTFLENNVAEEKLAVSPYGFDATHFKPSKKMDDVFRVLLVGNIGIQKGVHYLLEAWKDLKLPNSELVLIGRIEEEMEAVLKKYEGIFTTRGHLKHEELYLEYGQASVFILPSLQEGSALVSYEAMACGIPSIVTTNTGSVIRDGEDGFIIPIRDVDAIKEKILHRYENPDHGKQLGNTAQQYVQRFTWGQYTSNIIDVYKSLLNDQEKYL